MDWTPDGDTNSDADPVLGPELSTGDNALQDDMHSGSCGSCGSRGSAGGGGRDRSDSDDSRRKCGGGVLNHPDVSSHAKPAALSTHAEERLTNLERSTSRCLELLEVLATGQSTYMPANAPARVPPITQPLSIEEADEFLQSMGSGTALSGSATPSDRSDRASDDGRDGAGYSPSDGASDAASDTAGEDLGGAYSSDWGIPSNVRVPRAASSSSASATRLALRRLGAAHQDSEAIRL